MDKRGKIIKIKQHNCSMCGKNNIKTRWEKEKIAYGEKENHFELEVQIPIRTCGDCGHQFTDKEAEVIQHEAICRHIGRLSPTEIRNLRKQYNLSRKEFSELTEIGQASLARWETGGLIQNGANDQLLFLLKFPDNFERIRYKKAEGGIVNPVSNNRKITYFRALTPARVSKAREAGNRFELYSTALEN